MQRTKDSLLFVLLGCQIAVLSGCTMCASGNLCDYSAEGGKWQRANPSCGRVGSIFSDPEAYSVGMTSPAPGYDGEEIDKSAVEPENSSEEPESEPLLQSEPDKKDEEHEPSTDKEVHH